MGLPDVVYVVRPGERNEELRYSLRSLANLPHGKVWIAGYKPKWVNAGHIPSPAQTRGHAQTKANLRAACEHPEVSEEFVYMNDDFYIMQPLDLLPVMHRGLIDEAVRAKSMATSYTRSLEKTRQLLIVRGITEPLMYDLHAPMLVTKAGMLEILDLCDSAQLQERTLFGNLNHVGGEKRHNYKVRRRNSGWESWPFLSTNDPGFQSLSVGKYIRGAFPDQAPYEATPPPPEPIPQARRTPVRYRALRARPVGAPA